MADYMVFDTDGDCIEKHPDTGVTIIQDNAVAVASLSVYPGFDWKYANGLIRAMSVGESRLRRRKLKSPGLQAAEVAYEGFMSLLGLPITSSSGDVVSKLMDMRAKGETMAFMGAQLQPVEIQGFISGLMHDIEVNGGSYETL